MPQLILAIHVGPHDSGAAVLQDYSLKAAVQLERLTRHKGDGSFPGAAIDEVLSIAGASRKDVDVLAASRCLYPSRYFHDVRGLRLLREQFRERVRRRPRLTLSELMVRHQTFDVERLFDVAAFKRDLGLRQDVITHFFNHHEAHALPTIFFSPWDDALVVSADGGGDTVHYSHRHLCDGELRVPYGGEDYALKAPAEEDSIAKVYGYTTKALGFIRTRHEGKVTGLAAMGRPVCRDEIAARLSVDEDGRVHSDFGGDREIYSFMRGIAARNSREDVAASVQDVLEDIMLTSIRQVLARNPARHLGVSGGLFANVKLNRLLAERLPIDEIFIFPAMGDEGLTVGGALSYLMKRDGLKTWLDRRTDLTSLYLGRDYTGSADRVLAESHGIRCTSEDPVAGSAARLAEGRIGAIYTGRMEYGPRALGARSILANPSRRETHDLLNFRLSRSEFMPFAPVVTAGNADSIFDISPVMARACENMTITCNVKPEWRSRIAAVVHVDGSARPQIIERNVNPLYYDILAGFERATGLPVLVNTSFNVHEEPIVNTPAECARALQDGRIDFVVTQGGLYERG
jgi:carbamoyltransferase